MNKAKIAYLALAPLAALFAYGAGSDKPEPAPDPPQGAVKIDKSTIEASQRRVADWMFDNRPSTAGGRSTILTGEGWAVGVWFTGIFSLYEQTKDGRYLALLKKDMDDASWKIRQEGSRLYFGDDQCIAQAYLDMYSSVEQDPRYIAHAKEVFDAQMLSEDPGMGPHTTARSFAGGWSWADCIYMAPPAWARMYRATGDIKYLDYMDNKLWKENGVVDYLYDKGEKLFFRDESYFGLQEKNGQKQFWGRGNGWVMAGLARVMDAMPKGYPNRKKYEGLFVEMAGRIKGLQQPDGLWHSSLLDSASYPNGDSSATAMYVYAFAWGVNNGLLGAEDFGQPIAKGWQALVRCIQPDGRLGWSQQIGQAPGANISANSAEVYTVGAFQLAAREVLALPSAAPLN